MGKRKLSYSSKNRRFHGNKYIKLIKVNNSVLNTNSVVHNERSSDTNTSSATGNVSASHAKLQGKVCEMEVDSNEQLTGFRFIDCELLLNFIKGLLCPHCQKPLGGSDKLSSVQETRHDLASQFIFHCDCSNEVSFTTSKICNKVFEINRRFPLSMFAIGRHQQQGKRFLGNMNIPSSLNSNTWANHRDQIRKATEAVAEISQNVAAEEARLATGSRDVTVSGDGTYHRRGFQSKNAVVTVLSVNGKNSKVLDTEVLSNHCDSCQKKGKKLTGKNLEEWKKNHKESNKCDQNHTGSAAAMEPKGAKEIFTRSEKRHGLRYVNYLGDGDSKTYTTLKEENIYSVPINKFECCGHVQKRMGRHLTNKVQEMKNRTFIGTNGRRTTGIGGKGSLTKKVILRIQGHYGAAIRNNSNNLDAMKKAIWAIYEHRNKQHQNCGQWCPSKTGVGDPDKNALPPHVCDAIMPVFETLTEDTLLKKCLHGGNQNTNEAFHNLIWERCPKTCFVGKKRLSLAVADATIVYNEGESGRLGIFARLGFDSGVWTKKCFIELDRKRITAGQKQASDVAKCTRQNCSVQNASNDANSQQFYLAGGHE